MPRQDRPLGLGTSGPEGGALSDAACLTPAPIIPPTRVITSICSSSSSLSAPCDRGHTSHTVVGPATTVHRTASRVRGRGDTKEAGLATVAAIGAHAPDRSTCPPFHTHNPSPYHVRPPTQALASPTRTPNKGFISCYQRSVSRPPIFQIRQQHACRSGPGLGPHWLRTCIR